MGKARNAIRDEGENEFPLEEIDKRLRSSGRSIELHEDAVEEMLVKSNEKRQRLLLSLLWFPETVSPHKDYDVDHLFPDDGFEDERLYDEFDLSANEKNDWMEMKDQTLNKQLLPDGVNKAKSTTEFDSWAADRDEEHFDRNAIPTNESLWKFENFDQFVNRRRELIKQKLLRDDSIFPNIDWATE